MNKMFPIETPCYSIDYNELEYNVNSLKNAFSKHWNGPLCIGYSVKTNHLKWILEYMKQKGIYAEVVSSDEYKLAELLGFNPTEIIFNGPNKTNGTLKYAINNNGIVNVDSFSELNQLTSFEKVKPPKIGLRVNFDLESECPGESAMGYEPSRFGFCLENGSFESALKICHDSNIIVSGLHMHQSTKTRSDKVFSALARKAVECIENYKLQESIEYIDIGGGFFGGRNVSDKPSFEEYAKVICGELAKAINTERTMLIIEPGASLVSTPISYFTRVVDIKEVRGSKIVTVDGSLLHVNPFFVKRNLQYKVIKDESLQLLDYDQIICGSTCMENDRFFCMENGPELKIGDVIEVEKCGSYSMCYNSCFIKLPPAVFVKKNNYYYKVREAWTPEAIAKK